MLQFFGGLFTQNLAKVIKWEVRCNRLPDGNTPLDPSIAVEIYAGVGILGIELLSYEMKSAAKKAGRIHQQLETDRMIITYGQMSSLLRELRERMEDDMHSVVFVSLSTEESDLYNNPLKGWESVRNRFHKMQYDIEETSKCFALARYGAAVFHVLLIAEFGIIKVAELFGAVGDKPGWGSLDRLDKINDKKWTEKSEIEKKYAEFLKSLLPLAFSIKDSWRHKLNHVDNKLEWMDTDFSPEVAREIIFATRGFMRRLASDLPE